MVLSGADQSVECVFTSSAASPESAAIVPALDHGPVENPIIFVRAPGQNPGGECYEAPEVHAADGALLGWILDPEGC